MKLRNRLSVIVVAILAIVAPSVRADVITLSFPGASSTYAEGIDGNNIVGRYSDGTGSHGFIYNGSTYSSFGAPGTNGELRGISGSNVVGIFAGSSGEQPFFYNGSTFTPISVPGAMYATVFAVAGTTALGQYGDAQGNARAFLQDGTTITTISIGCNWRFYRCCVATK